MLIVDDSPEDRESLRRLLGKIGVSHPIVFCQTGEEALDYLLHRGTYSESDSAPRPGVILLDLNLPGASGHDVLARIKEHSPLRRIPVIILTSSDRRDDIEQSYDQGANSYVQKLADLDQFARSLAAFKGFWLDDALVPEVR